jgi:TatD DNase family protein
MRYIDAHNHLQDVRLAPFHESIAAECRRSGLVLAAVNGSSPSDWTEVATLAHQHEWVIPNFGVHPWHIKDLPANWEDLLCKFLDAVPSGVGETGIDGWRKEFDAVLQERIFVRQLEIAAARNLPISIHGLRRWGRLLELLQSNPRPSCGFLLHSYGGPAEMVPAFVKLGGYFSCPGFFLQPGREMKLAVFRHVPRGHLLIETDAPDQNLPKEIDSYQLAAISDGARINNPANITAVYRGVAALLGCSLEELCIDVERNFRALFEPVLRARPRDMSLISR